MYFTRLRIVYEYIYEMCVHSKTGGLIKLLFLLSLYCCYVAYVGGGVFFLNAHTRSSIRDY